MKTTLRYFKQHAKDTLIRAAIIAFICLVIATMVAGGIIDTYESRMAMYIDFAYGQGSNSDWTLNPNLGFFVAFSAILTTLLPMLELSCFNNRKYLDSAFSFPISRISLISVNLINGFLQFLAAYSISFIWYAIMLIPCADKISYPALWSFFFISLLCSLFYYSVNAFFFSVCNSSVDGFLTAAAWQFIVGLALFTFDDMIGGNFEEVSALNLLWMPLVQISDYFTTVSKGRRIAIPDLGTDNPHAMTIYLIVIPILTVLFVAGILYFFNKRRAESAGEISNTPFSYKTLLPVSTGIMLYWSIDAPEILPILALIFATVGYIVYRRSVKLKILDIVVIAACFVCFLMGLLG